MSFLYGKTTSPEAEAMEVVRINAVSFARMARDYKQLHDDAQQCFQMATIFKRGESKSMWEDD